MNKRNVIIAIIVLVIAGVVGGYFYLNQRVSLPKTSSPPPTSEPTRPNDLTQQPDQQSLPGISLPEGFAINYFAEDVPGARSLTISPETGIVYVGTRGEGNLYAVIDDNNDNQADRVVTIDEGLNSPNGVAWYQGDLYVAQISQVTRYRNIDNTYESNPQPELINNQFPNDSSHGWKYIAFGPDDKLYVPVGAPCNICNPDDSMYGALHRMNPDGSNLERYAYGIRNTVGFDWHPESNVLWFTDNGRDWLGDNRPPDELNKALEPGLNFGYPFCHGTDIQDPEFGQDVDCSQYQAPEQELGPHVAALGMTFYDQDMFPEEYQDKVFIAEHGSWNRSVPIGYRVTTVDVNDGQASNYQVFAEGWLNDDGTNWGRPVDVITMEDGSLLVSDDASGSIYRISYSQ